MQLELENKLFLLEDYYNKSIMEEDIKQYINKLKNNYPNAIVTKEFYKGRGILVRATQIQNSSKNKNANLEKEELQNETVRIREKGIRELRDNIERNIKNRKARELGRSNESERER